MTQPSTPTPPPFKDFQIPKEVVYHEQREHHGRVHNTMYALPPAFAIVLGALWYFAAEQFASRPAISAIIFVFSALTANYFRAAFNSIAQRAAELRQHLQVFEGDFAFYNDTRKELARAEEVYRRYHVLMPERLSDEIAGAGSLPPIEQTKTRDAFLRLMRQAVILAWIGATISIVKVAIDLGILEAVISSMSH